jgi:hypothetical protein
MVMAAADSNGQRWHLLLMARGGQQKLWWSTEAVGDDDIILAMGCRGAPRRKLFLVHQFTTV